MSPMPQPGWYADPDGTPERLRWWDGTRWTENVHGGAGSVPPAGGRRRGLWPWVALVLVAGLVVAVGFGLSAGLLGTRETTSGTGVPPVAPSPRPSTPMTVPASPTTQSPLPQLPPVTAAPESPPVQKPEPYPTIPETPPAVDDVCPEPASDAASLTDGQLTLALPDDWTLVDGLTWLTCAQAATSVDQTMSVTLGVSPLPTTSLEEAAHYVWSIALLDAAIPHPLSQTSTPVSVGGLDGWMVTGTVGLHESVDELTVVVVDAGGETPSVVVTLVGTQDVEGRATIDDILNSVGPA